MGACGAGVAAGGAGCVSGWGRSGRGSLGVGLAGVPGRRTAGPPCRGPTGNGTRPCSARPEKHLSSILAPRSCTPRPLQALERRTAALCSAEEAVQGLLVPWSAAVVQFRPVQGSKSTCIAQQTADAARRRAQPGPQGGSKAGRPNLALAQKAGARARPPRRTRARPFHGFPRLPCRRPRLAGSSSAAPPQRPRLVGSRSPATPVRRPLPRYSSRGS